MADADERRARFKVLIGGAHPEGRLSAEAKAAFERNVEEMRSEDAVREIAELLEDIYYEHGETVITRLRKYSRAYTALKLDKHITFVEHQNEILDGGREGTVDDECAQCLYESDMMLLSMSIRKWASMYENLDYRPE